jgi:hypothetical protein
MLRDTQQMIRTQEDNSVHFPKLLEKKNENIGNGY